MPANIEIYRDIAIRAVESVFESEYHNTLGIPMPQIKILLPDDADYITGQYYIMIDDTWQIHLNFGKLPISFKEFEDEVKVLTRHEIEHYMCCPFDVITHLRMLKCIIDVYKKEFSHLDIDIQHACGSISNQAADIIVDTKNYLRNPQDTLVSEINWIKKGANIKSCPRHNKLMFLTKEALWNESLEINETDQELLTIVYELAEKFKVNGIEDRSSFLSKTEEYARTFLKLYIKDRVSSNNTKQDNQSQQDGQSQQGNQFQQGNQSQQGGQSQQANTPQQNGQNHNNVKPKDGDKNGSAFIFADLDNIKEALTALAEETNVEEFSDILSASGIKFLSESEKHKLWFSIQSANIIPIEEYANTGNKEKYTFPSTWRFGDPIGSIDIMLSFMTSPKILPGITTKKWELATRDTRGIEKKQRDLLLAVDTSGSMGSVLKSNDNMHQAVLAAYGILSYFESVKGKIALIEFDNTIRKNVSWTDDYDSIRNALLINGRGGTTFPIRSIQSVLDQSTNELVTVLITDGELNNVNESVAYFREYLYDDNKLYIFVLGDSKSINSYNILKDIGAKIYSAKLAKDFCDMVMADLA
ncbi:vWA domain-containing protein [Bacteroides acidifaciens]|uniref:vWA domain-containing protein n=2 Tax=Bacteroides acidifaciens TaxID=85831 RepID=UPI00242B9CC6|nr:vWA domain-containing protein [Bacteroides acidifaciens]